MTPSETSPASAPRAALSLAVASHAARAAVYRSLSALVSSPAQAPWSVSGVRAAVDHLVQGALWLPYALDCSTLTETAARLDDAGVAAAAAHYGSQFEVGERGPPLPIRAELAPGANPASKEELARFYELFHYEVGEADAWQLDHLAVTLEFLQVLAFRAAESDEREIVASYGRGARDVLARHVLSWLPPMAEQLARAEVHPLLCSAVLTAAEHAGADHAWLTNEFD